MLRFVLCNSNSNTHANGISECRKKSNIIPKMLTTSNKLVAEVRFGNLLRSLTSLPLATVDGAESQESS